MVSDSRGTQMRRKVGKERLGKGEIGTKRFVPLEFYFATGDVTQQDGTA